MTNVPRWPVFRHLLRGAIGITLLNACASSLPPLQGVAPANATLPPFALPPMYRQVVFTWEFEQNSIVARGNGVARLAPPDSVRVDIFLAGGFGGASAILIGDSLRLPPGGAAMAGGLIPPTPLIWAVFGRLGLPALQDTTIRVLGDTLAADVGRPKRWRMTAVRHQLIRLDRVTNDHVAESVEHLPGGEVRYESSDHRSIVLHIQRELTMPAFDAAIWHF